MKYPRLLPVFLLFAFLAIPHQAQAQTPVTDVLHIATSVWAELARYAQSAYDVYQQGEQIYNQYQQIERQIQALKKLDIHTWRDIAPFYDQLDNVLEEAETLTYVVEDLEEQFYVNFPGVTSYSRFPEENAAGVQRILATFRANLMGLHTIHETTEGSLEELAGIQLDVERAEGTQQGLESLAELAAWQANQLATIGRTLQANANAQIIASSYAISADARLKQTHTDTLAITLYRAEADAARPQTPYSFLPAWMPR